MLLSALLKSALVLAVANSLVSAADLPYGNIIRSCTVTNTFALTFDDGPSNFTRQLLQRLKENGLKATFFVVCLNAKREGPLLRQILEEGHQIASHTYSHPFLTSLSEDLVRSQMTDLDAVLIKTIGKAACAKDGEE
ncbi:Glycoside hydrolase/deacetylase, beta/alpha-barrel [Metarhizium guizhouense ARSEF 977]|uniref:Glycoside hydrolase/deacetylase, beta/alpha-barrel n=1 Tax=Metarhizium guizhouense (strain ARSEF 977) TaxID=1276136 RepID=A0A0B4GGB5_METGA|nr:Glycoside hydrolase/deacetylase, beta/alpha-barrel [Metarhizium guizhouense ARSEF 977]